MKIINTWVLLICLVAGNQAAAHHSYYAVYDVDRKISITGTLVRIEFRQPHIGMELLVDNPDGSTELWFIESTSPQRWERMGKPRDFADPGDVVTLEGWPARNGHDEMLLSAITTELDRIVIINQVRQPR